ncbi:MAG TPA: ABC transporter ATP-binding protein [Longimicrobiaceae bacterium]|nr:ABC transporter ATP-binding protein [Longimicrobiaceae bacterium]
MANPRIDRLARWRALLGLLWRAARWRAAGFGVLLLVMGLLPTAVILATGALVRSIPGAVESGLLSAGGQPTLVALAALGLFLGGLALGGNAVAHLSRVLDYAFALEVHQTVARATLGTPGLAPLEDPVLADELQAIQDADRRGVLWTTMTALSSVVTTRLQGIGAFVVLLGFEWWAPLLLLAAWQLTNLLDAKATENGVSVNMNDGAVKMRRSEYLRSLAVDPPAAKEIRVFGLSGWVVERYADAWMDALRVMWRSRRANKGLAAATTLTLALSHAAVLGALGLAASRGDIDAAALLVFMQAVIATADLGMIGDWRWLLTQSLAVAERTAGLRSRVPSASPAEPAEPAEPPAGRGGKVALRLDGVRFTYRGRERPALDGLSLEIPAGQSLAIVGENGAGKSTLIKLLCGLYEPDAGRITVDGGMSPRQARGRIGVIFQDFVRYPLPLRENVAFGHLPLLDDSEALEGALRDAGGAGLLGALPGGWDTVLSREFEGGADLSGGQWQRVALARALTAVRGGAGLLILDEPTASLDVRAETELFERFLEVTRGVTTILVSHRLSSVRHADRIVVLHGGRVVEDGTHDELMRAGGRYAGMFTLQSERFSIVQVAGVHTAEEAHHA